MKTVKNYSMNESSLIKAFKKINKIRLLSIIICILIAFSSSCGLTRDIRRRHEKDETVEKVSESEGKGQSKKEEPNSPSGEANEDNDNAKNDPKESSDSLEVEFVITNSCKEDIGMIAILDPVTKEQVNIGELPDGKLISFTLTWPADETDFNMAVYNKNGDLVSESKIDVTGVTEKVILLLSGDHNVENVEVKIE